MAKVIIELLENHNEISDEIKLECDALWQECINFLKLNNDEYQELIYDNNVFSHHSLAFESSHFAANIIQIKQQETEFKEATLEQKVLAKLHRQPKQEDSYFNQYANQYDVLKKVPGITKENKQFIDQQIEQLDKLYRQSQRKLLQLAIEASEEKIKQSAKNQGVKYHPHPEIDFEEAFSKKQVLKAIKEYKEFAARRNYTYWQDGPINKKDKQILLKQCRYSDQLTKLWLDSMEDYVSKPSRKYLSQVRHFLHGSLGMIAFAGLCAMIVTGIIMAGPFAPAVVITAVLVFKLAGAISAVCGLINFASMLTEVTANKLYYKQNPTKAQVATILVSALFVTVGMGVKAIGNSLVWLGQNFIKLWLQGKGVINNDNEAKDAISKLHENERITGVTSDAFILMALGGKAATKDSNIIVENTKKSKQSQLSRDEVDDVSDALVATHH